jgi:hypothetical protein
MDGCGAWRDLGALAGQGGGEPPGVAGQGTAQVLTGVPGTGLWLCVSLGLAVSGGTSGLRCRRRGPSR